MKFKLLSITLLFMITSFVSNAQTTFASPFSNNMVLQRNDNVKIWGNDNPNTSINITTSWNDQVYPTSTDSNGKWSVSVSTPEGSDIAYTLTATGTTTTTVSNLLIGEVWMCSGQSNMEMAFGWGEVDLALADAILASATDDKIRGIRNNRLRSLDEQESFPDTENWKIITGNTAKWFSMVAYYYAKKLREELGVPIGLINNSYGGSSIEAWLDTETANQFNYITIPTELTAPEYRLPTVIYNAAVNPWVGFGMKGVLWYQGESNKTRPDEYAEMFPAMVNSWRTKWGIGDFPFYYVQIVPFASSPEAYLPFWNVQRKAHYEIPNSGVVVTLDKPSCDQIHPQEKDYIGDRLAYWALSKDYGFSNVVSSGPLATSVIRTDNILKVNFDYAETGLVAGSSGLTGFEVAGINGVYYTANAQINLDNTLTLSSPSVAEPKYARYSSEPCSTIEATLFNGAELPASPFILEDIGNIAVTGVSVNPEIATLGPIQTLQLIANFTPSNATNRSVIWSSSNPSVASVNTNSGLVTAVAEGEPATITATTSDGEFTDTSTITVNIVAVSGVTVNPETGSLAPSETLQLTANIIPSNAANKSVTWSSSNPSVATVDSNGLITAVAEGEPATITATTSDGGFTDTSTITVNSYPDDLISISGPTVVNQGATVVVNISYTASTTRDIVLSFQENGVDINGDTNKFTAFGTTRATVSVGQGMLSLDVATSASAPIASGYRYAAYLTTVGGGFSQRVDAGPSMTGISVTAPLSTSTFEKQMYSVYPNPSDDFIQVEIPNASFSKVQFRLYDLLGKLVFEELVNPRKDKWEIGTSGLSKGIHVLEITADDQVVHHKVIKK